MKQMMLALTTVFTLTAIASTTQAQGLTFAPSKGQSTEQQAKDGAECQAVAVQQSGFDPARAAAATPSQPAPGGERVKGAARGAAVGAAAGAIGGDAGKGAAAGAAAGTVVAGSEEAPGGPRAGGASPAAAGGGRARPGRL